MRKVILFALSLLGLFDSAYLWWVYTSPSRPMVCLGTGCDVVRASPFASVLGTPLPVYGVAMYAVLSLLIFAEALAFATFAKSIRYAVAGISGVGVLISLYLTGIEAFVLHAWCAWCVASAVSVTMIFALAVLEIFRAAPPSDSVAALATVRKHAMVFVTALAVGGPTFIFLSRHGGVPPARPPSLQTLLDRLVRPDSHATGNPRAPLTVVEFADFECPYCGHAEQSAREIRKKFATEVRFVFRHYPLERLHPQAEKAAEASECAAEQGKFWEAAEKFYAQQSDLSEAALDRYAGELGLDQAHFRDCLSSGKMVARVRRDVEDGDAVGIRATPTFFIGQRKIEGPLEFEQFSQLVEQELAIRGLTLAQSQTLPQTPPQGRSVNFSQQPAAHKPASDPGPASPGLLGNRPNNVFSQFQTSGMACSEQDASKEQPILISTAEARRLFESKALFVDVRPAKDFVRERISGAVNVPVDHIEQRWSHLPRDRSVILYESGLSPGDICASGRAAGRVLLSHGFAREQVKVYQEGLAAWEKAGLPTAR